MLAMWLHSLYAACHVWLYMHILVVLVPHHYTAWLAHFKRKHTEGGLGPVCIAGVVQQHEAHNAEVNCLAFNPYSEHILATGSADKTVRPLTKSPLSASWPSLIQTRSQ